MPDLVLANKIDRRVRAAVGRAGMRAAVAVLVLGLAYAAVLGLGFLTLEGPDQPIGDPWFTILELLILALMPAMVALMAAVHAWSPAEAKPLSLSALAFMVMTAVLTMGIHFTILALGRLPELQGQSWTRLLLTFRWPSVPYAIDILAWDLLFPLSMLLAAPLFRGDPLAKAVRLLMIASGLLSLAGLIGVAKGDMQLRNIGIPGYTIVFLVIVTLLALFFRRETAGESA